MIERRYNRIAFILLMATRSSPESEMQKPDESLDDFIVQALPEIIAEPPRRVTLRFTGEVEVLKPLTHAYVRPASSRALWFRRSLALGGGFAVIALIFASAIFVGIYDEGIPLVADPTEFAVVLDVPYVAEVPEPDAIRTQSSPRSEPASIETKKLSRSFSAFRTSARPRVANRQPDPLRQTPLVESGFVPTTLVIYIDKGEIKTRIEPQLTAGYKKAPTLSN